MKKNDIGMSYLVLATSVVGLVASVMKLKDTIDRGRAKKALHELNIKQIKKKAEMEAAAMDAMEASYETKMAKEENELAELLHELDWKTKRAKKEES